MNAYRFSVNKLLYNLVVNIVLYVVLRIKHYWAHDCRE